ncbi:MAG: hypothetical protein KDE33_07695 [Bacteroidetes bacterium]|nr:hypothetical protein [Bacteroidota bacterium]
MTDNNKYISYLLLAFFAVMLVFSFITRKLYSNYEQKQVQLEQMNR